jgi:predicted ribonuclease YlaK
LRHLPNRAGSTDYLPDEQTPVVVLSSQMGAGKSLEAALAALGVVLLVFH